MNGYVTSYIEDSLFVYQIPLLIDGVFVESVIFEKLSKFRTGNDREFFKIEIEKIKKVIDEVSQLLLNCSDLLSLSKLKND